VKNTRGPGKIFARKFIAITNADATLADTGEQALGLALERIPPASSLCSPAVMPALSETCLRTVSLSEHASTVAGMDFLLRCGKALAHRGVVRMNATEFGAFFKRSST